MGTNTIGICIVDLYSQVNVIPVIFSKLILPYLRSIFLAIDRRTEFQENVPQT